MTAAVTTPAGRGAPEHESRDMCRRVALELELLRQTGMRLEQSLCRVADAWGIDSERVRDLQELDSLIQHLAALRDLLGAVGAATGDVQRVLISALERVPLEEMRGRLSGASRAPVSVARDIEIF